MAGQDPNRPLPSTLLRRRDGQEKRFNLATPPEQTPASEPKPPKKRATPRRISKMNSTLPLLPQATSETLMEPKDSSPKAEATPTPPAQTPSLPALSPEASTPDALPSSKPLPSDAPTSIPRDTAPPPSHTLDPAIMAAIRNPLPLSDLHPSAEVEKKKRGRPPKNPDSSTPPKTKPKSKKRPATDSASVSPKRPRGRPRKDDLSPSPESLGSLGEAPPSGSLSNLPPEIASIVEKRPRGRPRKPNLASAPKAPKPSSSNPPEDQVKRPRGRPKKSAPPEDLAAASDLSSAPPSEPKPRRGRPKKSASPELSLESSTEKKLGRPRKTASSILHLPKAASSLTLSIHDLFSLQQAWALWKTKVTASSRKQIALLLDTQIHASASPDLADSLKYAQALLFPETLADLDLSKKAKDPKASPEPKDSNESWVQKTNFRVPGSAEKAITTLLNFFPQNPDLAAIAQQYKSTLPTPNPEPSAEATSEAPSDATSDAPFSPAPVSSSPEPAPSSPAPGPSSPEPAPSSPEPAPSSPEPQN